MRDTKEKLSNLTITLHWIVGLTVITLAVIGVYMSENEAFELYPIHKSIGVLIFFVIVARVYWRFINGWLQPIADYSTVEHEFSKNSTLSVDCCNYCYANFRFYYVWCWRGWRIGIWFRNYCRSI